MLRRFFDGINLDGIEFVFEQQVLNLFRVESLFDLQPHGLVPPGWGKGSKSRTSKIFIIFAINFLECNCQFKHLVLFWNDFLSENSDCRFECHRMGLEVK